jgi:tetratricopeptide (TPR) repeat protein
MAKTERHPTAELDRLLAGNAAPDERQRAVDHLLLGCSTCARRMARALTLFAQPRPSEDALRAAVARAVARFPQIREEVAREEALAERLLEALADQPHGRALMVLASSRKYRRRAVAERLLTEAQEARHNDAREALQLAEQALAVARAYDGAGEKDLRARAWMELGNARRINGDLTGADTAFAKASTWLASEGGTDPRLWPELQMLLATLRADQRSFDEAASLNRVATQALERARDRHGLARARLQRGYLAAQRGDLAAAMPATWEGLLLLGPNGDLDSLFAGIHNLLHWIAETGQHRLAAELMETARPLYELCAGETDLVRLDWTRARLYLQRPGWLDDAGFLLEEVRDRFAALDLPYEVALVSLDLAAVYTTQGRTFELREVAREMLPIFRRLGVARETLATLTLLRRAEAREAATAGIIRKLAETVGGEQAIKRLPRPGK